MGCTLPEENTVAPLELSIGGVARPVRIDRLIVAGWTGRDRAAVEHHIAELAALGVQRPRSIPCFYRLGANLLTTSSGAIDVAGAASSGEVEWVLFSLADGVHVGIGSDHTDRKVEAYSVTVSKQMCPKPIGREVWRLGDVQAHWDDLILRSWVTRGGGQRTLYQEGLVTKMLAPEDLVARYLGQPGVLPIGTAMYGGTLPVKGDIGGGERFDIELEDPTSGRTLRHGYALRCLDIAD